MDGLFGPMGRSDPQAVLRSSPAPGCRYGFVKAALHDPRLEAAAIPDSPDLMFRTVARFMARLPRERQRAVRGHFTGLFTPRRVERYRAGIEARLGSLVDALPSAGPVDLVATIARPLPFAVIADVLGVPVDRQPWLAEATEVIGRAVAGQRDHANVERGNAAVADVLDHFDEALRDRAAAPREDVLSLLAAAPSSGERRADLLANCLFFVLAGHATTTALLAASVDLLARHPGQLARLLADPAGWPTAVEELLRFVSPTTLTGVTSRVDAEVDGCPVREGARVALAWIWRGRRTRTWRSRRGRISASAHRWPGCTPRSRCRRCSAGCRGCIRRRRRSGWGASRSGRSRRCRSAGRPRGTEFDVRAAGTPRCR